MTTTVNSTRKPYSESKIPAAEAINFSTSKQKYSFSRDKRFKSIAGTVATPFEFTHSLKGTFG